MPAVAADAGRPSLEEALSDLERGVEYIRSRDLAELTGLIDACGDRIAPIAKNWVQSACEAKRISADRAVAAEDILTGPGTLLRYLRLIARVFRDIERTGQPSLPGKIRRNSNGQICVPIFPSQGFFDRITFMGITAEMWLEAAADEENLFDLPQDFGGAEPGIALVLGAGNVSAIPATDMLFKIFHEGQSVLLKLNPVNEYLDPIFANVFKPLIDANLLRIVKGGGDVGKTLAHHPKIASIHITGSHLTHDRIVWGETAGEQAKRKADDQPLIDRPITSELGNVSPWIIVPGKYSQRQLESQAQHVAASITNNVSFNCLATKMIVTSKSWAQRNQFLDRVEEILSSVPERFSYYPGAAERFERATGLPAKNSENLPWTLIRDADPVSSPHLFREESFVCVCAETALESSDPKAFLTEAVDFVNEQLFGTLCVSLTITNADKKQNQAQLDAAISKLNYGSVCINQWSGVSYGLMTPAWGGHPSGTVVSPQSGVGHVHNTYRVKGFDKSVIWGPLCNFPKPIWFPTHRSANLAAWALLKLYDRPSIMRLPSLFFHALRG